MEVASASMTIQKCKPALPRILTRRNTLERGIDHMVVEGMREIFPSLFKDDTVDPARSGIMAVITHIGCLAFSAYKEPTNEGIKEVTEDQTTIRHLQRDWVLDHMEGVLKITLKDAKNLRNADGLNGKSDPYIVFSVGGACVKSHTIRNDKNPVWNSTHYLFLRKKHLLPQSDRELKICCFDCDTIEGCYSFLNVFRKDDHLGSATLPLGVVRDKREQTFELKLHHHRNNKRRPSTVRFSTELISVEKAFKDMNVDNMPNVWSMKFQSRSFEWEEMMKLNDCGLSDVEEVAYIDAPSTGTQAWIHGNASTKTAVVAFRGTEINTLKDIMTDINCIPTRLRHPRQSKIAFKYSSQYLDKNNLVHNGFKKAYDSVRESILRILYDLTNWDGSWKIVVTGHSLGGALATLCAFELANLQHSPNHSNCPKAFSRNFFTEATHPTGPRIWMMNFGAPKVGNKTFVKHYDETMKQSFRVVNANDLVHFLPPIFCQHTRYELLLRDTGRIEIEGVSLQAVHSKEERDLINHGKVNDADLVKRAFSHLSIAQHLGSHYLSLVKTAIDKLVEHLMEVQQIQELDLFCDEASDAESGG